MNLTRDLLVAGYGRTLPAQLTVIELLETVTPDDAVVEACRALKASGYMIALDDFVYRSGHERLLELADIVKFCFRDTDYKTQIQHVRRLGPNVKLLAEKVETREEYDHAAALGCDYFQGYFFCRPEIVSGRALSGFRLSYLRLLQAVTRPDVSLDELDNVIRSDLSIAHRLMKYLATMPKAILTVGTMIDSGVASSSAIAREIGKDQVLAAKLLKLVNSGFCGFRSPIASISQATLLLGLDALRMLIYSTTVLDLARAANHRMKGFWEHAVGTARTSALLAERVGLPHPEELAVAGLMHDIGKVVIARWSPTNAITSDGSSLSATVCR